MEFFGNKEYEKKMRFNGIFILLCPFVLLGYLIIEGILTPSNTFPITLLVVIPVAALGVLFIKSVNNFSIKTVVIVGDEEVQVFMPFQKKNVIEFKDITFMKRKGNIVYLNKSKLQFLRINLDLVANESQEQLYELLCQRNPS